MIDWDEAIAEMAVERWAWVLWELQRHCGQATRSLLLTIAAGRMPRPRCGCKSWEAVTMKQGQCMHFLVRSGGNQHGAWTMCALCGVRITYRARVG